MVSKASVFTLNRLIDECQRSQEYYRQAAEVIGSDELSNVFIDFSAQRRDFAAQLSTLFGDDDETHPNRRIGGATADHRDEFTIELVTNNPEVMLTRFERGETELLDAYEDALEKADDPDVMKMIIDQYEQVMKSRRQIWHLMGQYS